MSSEYSGAIIILDVYYPALARARASLSAPFDTHTIKSAATVIDLRSKDVVCCGQGEREVFRETGSKLKTEDQDLTQNMKEHDIQE